MAYVIAAIIVVVIVGSGIAALVWNASRKQRQAAVADSEYGGGTPGSDMAIVAPDENTPLGDTDQHAGEQTREGKTVRDQDAERSGGSGRAVGSGYAGTPEIGESDREPSPTRHAGGEGGVGGEGEGSRRITPESERLANRER